MKPGQNWDKDLQFCTTFWQQLVEIIPQWRYVQIGHTTPSEVRANTIASHGVVIHALGELGRFLSASSACVDDPKILVQKMQPLAEIDWSKANPAWFGRVISPTSGNLLANRVNVKLMLTYFKVKLGVPSHAFSPQEKELEVQYLGNSHLFNHA
jgi:DNA sulfur modification protein DndB